MTDDLREIGIDQMRRGAYQPRRHFDETALDELAESIRAHGLAQPTVVRPCGQVYEIIAGERRWGPISGPASRRSRRWSAISMTARPPSCR